MIEFNLDEIDFWHLAIASLSAYKTIKFVWQVKIRFLIGFEKLSVLSAGRICKKLYFYQS